MGLTAMETQPEQEASIDWAKRDEREMQERIFLRYWPTASALVERLLKNLPANVDKDALRSEAMLGLLDAIKKFDTERGHKFETYFPLRVRGACFDVLRSYDQGRLYRQRWFERESAEETLTATLGRQPSAEEVIEFLGWSRVEYFSSLNRRIDSLDAATYDVKTAKMKKRFEAAAQAAVMCTLRDGLRGRTLEEQTIAYLYYVSGATMRNIGDVMGLSESRVSQLHSRLIEDLRSRGIQHMKEAMF